MMKIKNNFSMLGVLIWSILPTLAHDHFAVGFMDMNANAQADAGEPLRLVDATPTGRLFHLLPRPTGLRGGGYYMLGDFVRDLFPLDAFSIIALSDGQYSMSDPRHARTGAWIWAEIVSVKGPADGTFSFWEENSNVPTHQLVANQPTGNPAFPISEGIDDVSDDPSGHIHGRAWAADRPGEYQVGIRFVDFSTTGPNDEPWHRASEIYTFRFTAGPSFQPSFQKNPDASVSLTWSSQMGIWNDGRQTGMVFTVQRSTSLAQGSWQSLGTVTGTTAEVVNFTDSNPPVGQAFYRLTYDWSKP